MKRLCYVAEARDCFNLQGDWGIMAHNLDDAGGVRQVGTPLSTQVQAEALCPASLIEGSWALHTSTRPATTGPDHGPRSLAIHP